MINEKDITRLAEALEQCDSVVVGAGSGLSTAAGFTYAGKRFDRYLSDLSSAIPSDLIPICPECGAPAATNLRIDGRFVEDEGWHKARDRYYEYLESHAAPGKRILFLELGVGFNTPVIIKYPF